MQRFAAPRRQQQTNNNLASSHFRKLEPASCLVSKDGSRLNFISSGIGNAVAATSCGKETGMVIRGLARTTIRRTGSRSGGLQRFCKLTRTASGRKIGIEPKYPRQGGSGVGLMGGLGETPDVKVTAPPKTDGPNTHLKTILLLSPEAEEAAIIQSVVPDRISLKTNKAHERSQNVCLIQAIFRGFLGRIDFKKHQLLQRLEAIEERQRTELRRIEAHKHQEMRRQHAHIVLKPKRREERWSSNSDLVALLIPEVRAARDKNTKLHRELVRLKKENKRLAITNTKNLAAAAKCERKVNCVERCGLQLRQVAFAYHDAMILGIGFVTKMDLPCRLSKISKIKQMIHITEKEDDLL